MGQTVWEIKQKIIVQMAADRGSFIDQSQSLNVHMSTPNFSKLTSLHFFAWKKGLKTGMYYLRTRAAARAIQFTVNNENTANISENSKTIEKKSNNKIAKDRIIAIDYRTSCIMCSG